MPVRHWHAYKIHKTPRNISLSKHDNLAQPPMRFLYLWRGHHTFLWRLLPTDEAKYRQINPYGETRESWSARQ